MIYICTLWWKIPEKSLMLTYGGGASTLILTCMQSCHMFCMYLIIPVLCFLSTNMNMLHEITSEDAEWEEAFADSSSNKPLQSAGKG